MEGGGEWCWGLEGVGWTRTPHQSPEPWTLVLSHCDADNTFLMPGLQPRGIGDFIIQSAASWGGAGAFQQHLIEVLQKAAFPL